MKNKKLDHIIYISIPEEMNHSIGNLKLNPHILLPIEIPEGIAPKDWDSRDLSWEMIISGMLKVMAYDRDHKDLPYYREFIKSSRPEIAAELTQSAVIKAQTGDFELAEEIFHALIGLDESDLRTRLNLTLLHENRLKTVEGMEREALLSRVEEEYGDLISFGEDLPDIYFNAAWFFYNRQEFGRAFELSSSYLVLGEDETKRSEAEKLRRECEELKDTDKDYREAFRLISEDLNEDGLDCINNFLEKNREIWNAWFLKGWALRKLSRFAEALTAFKEAERIKGNHIDILNEMAICLLELEKFEESRSCLQKALELDPENLKVISNMGILSLKEGNTEDAAAFFRTVLDLDPEDPIAADYLKFLEKSSNQD